MRPHEIVEALLQADGPISARTLIEASVHLPHRSTRWVASFRGETGQQVWRTTGLREREPALELAQRWESEARRKREAQGAPPRKPSMRVRPGSAEEELGLLSQREVAAIMRISERAVREIERRAFDKLRQHPALRDFWRGWQTGDIGESAWPDPQSWPLSRAEIAAVYALTRTPEERHVLDKLLAPM